jgi:hypothetical protein
LTQSVGSLIGSSAKSAVFKVKAHMAQFGEHDQAFFRALAGKGKDEWNKWRGDPANKDVRVTFAGVDFSESPNDKLNFEGFEFGDDADFSGCLSSSPGELRARPSLVP